MPMFGGLENITVEADKDQILTTLRNNRSKHRQIVEEARKGYLETAQRELDKRMALLREGKLVALHFDLLLPADYTEQYDLAIATLELHQGKSVELTSGQVQHLIRDRWDWMEQFLVSNKRYSGTARAEYSSRKGTEEG